MYMEGKDMNINILTPRELEVMGLLIQGFHNPEISRRLCISEHTTKAHISSIYEKLKVSNRVQAIVKYIKENFENIDKL